MNNCGNANFRTSFTKAKWAARHLIDSGEPNRHVLFQLNCSISLSVLGTSYDGDLRVRVPLTRAGAENPIKIISHLWDDAQDQLGVPWPGACLLKVFQNEKDAGLLQ